MGAETGIEWADHTFNPWWGCARVSAACQHCYAETLANRFQPGLWGKGGDRRFFGDKHWNEPLKWDRAAAKAGCPARVFCASMADVFEDRPDLDDHRARLWELIEDTGDLVWLLLTKRPENIPTMVPDRWMVGDWPPNVHAGTTVESNARVYRADHLRAVPAPVRFLSCEPLLGPLPSLDLTGIDQVIVGGESGPGSRPMHPAWVRDLRDRCTAPMLPINRRAFFFKQWGDWSPGNVPLAVGEKASAVHDWPGDTTSDARAWRIGKKAAGRELDGRTWDELPEARV